MYEGMPVTAESEFRDGAGSCVRAPLSLTSETAEEFVDWVIDAPVSDVASVRSAIAEGCDEHVIARLGELLLYHPVPDVGRVSVLMSILAESRDEAAVVPLERFIWRVSDLFAEVALPNELSSVTALCKLRAEVGVGLRACAAEMLVYLMNERALAGTLRVIREHPEAEVRRAAIDAFLYHHDNSEAAADELRSHVREEDRGRARHDALALPGRALPGEPAIATAGAA